MKQLLLIIICYLGLISTLHSQIEFGVKAGISSFDLANKGLYIHDENETFQWKILDAGYGHHLGFYTRWTLLGIYVEPALLFNSSTVNYNLKTYSEHGVLDVVIKDTYQGLDLPVIAGFKVGALRFQGGIVGHFFVDNFGDAFNIKGYSQKFKAGTFGWQAGSGIDIWRLRLDLMYEGNLSKFGDHIQINGQNYAFADTPSRLILTAGFKF